MYSSAVLLFEENARQWVTGQRCCRALVAPKPIASLLWRLCQAMSSLCPMLRNTLPCLCGTWWVLRYAHAGQAATWVPERIFLAISTPFSVMPQKISESRACSRGTVTAIQAVESKFIAHWCEQRLHCKPNLQHWQEQASLWFDKSSSLLAAA